MVIIYLPGQTKTNGNHTIYSREGIKSVDELEMEPKSLHPVCQKIILWLCVPTTSFLPPPQFQSLSTVVSLLLLELFFLQTLLPQPSSCSSFHLSPVYLQHLWSYHCTMTFLTINTTHGQESAMLGICSFLLPVYHTLKCTGQATH